MVIAHHLMWTLYGWWLPNDPRGSTSHAIHSNPLKDLGDLHFGRKRVQPTNRDIRRFYEQAAERLQHDLLSFTPDQFPAVAQSFDQAISAHGYTCYALAIMPDHVHLILRKHKDQAEAMIDKLQERARLRLSESGLRKPDHPTWAQGGYRVFLDAPEDVWRTIRYIEQNPVKQRLPVQRWPFITPYDHWPHHKAR